MISTNNNDAKFALDQPINDVESIENCNGLRSEYLSKLTNSCRNMGSYGDLDMHWMLGYLVLIVMAIAAYVMLL
jgi:hypothetical protein